MPRILESLNGVQAQFPTTTLIAIDGPSGAGKTTLALELQNNLANVAVIHMDDLFAGWENALETELYGRIYSCIFAPLSVSNNLRYQKFNWHTYQFDTWKEISPPQFLILEGVGAAAIPNRPWISLAIFLEVRDEIGLERVRIRDGEDVAEHIPAWQIMQRKHFAEHQTEHYADLVFAN